ncbi:MAG: adenylyl-sulfate kinase [Alphaproteobacteria bacterium]|nr:adenylyl-sulfate kinase [Alphaproteobacteria bacterium]
MAQASGGLLKIVVVGHVDHGKSTLIGRLLYDTGSLPPGKMEEIKAMSERRGMALEWSFLLDAMQAERDQNVTIDTTQIWFRTATRDIVIIDAPGHREFLKNMVSGAAAADGALLVVDAREGVREQTRRHGYLLHLLGIRQLAVVINKMDLVGHSRERFAEVENEITRYLGEIGVTPAYVIPISARDGDNVATAASSMPWYQGPTIVAALERFQALTVPVEGPLRLPIQDVYRFDARRIFAGRIESGILRVGDKLLFSPSGRSARVKTIEAWHAPMPVEVRAGQSVGFTLDEQIFVERGEIASHEDRPPMLTTVFRSNLFWLGAEPMEPGKVYKLKLGTREAPVIVQAIERIVDTDTLERRKGERVERNAVAEVVLRARDGKPLALDEYRSIARTGRFVLIDGYDTVAGGVISMEGYPDQRQALTVRSSNLFAVEHRVPRDVREKRNGHRGAVLWLTGLSGAGKSTLAMGLEQVLFQRGFHVYVLDGDNVRAGLNTNLSFSPTDRAENIRRVGEAAALFADAGFICITAFISPYQADRDRARAAAGTSFHEIYVQASLSTCETRDPKGLYKRARAGEIADFTGIDAPYEAPTAPEMVVDTNTLDIAPCLEQLADYVERNLAGAGSPMPPAARVRDKESTAPKR